MPSVAVSLNHLSPCFAQSTHMQDSSERAPPTTTEDARQRRFTISHPDGTQQQQQRNRFDQPVHNALKREAPMASSRTKMQRKSAPADTEVLGPHRVIVPTASSSGAVDDQADQDLPLPTRYIRTQQNQHHER